MIVLYRCQEAKPDTNPINLECFDSYEDAKRFNQPGHIFVTEVPLSSVKKKEKRGIPIEGDIWFLTSENVDWEMVRSE